MMENYVDKIEWKSNCLNLTAEVRTDEAIYI